MLFTRRDLLRTTVIAAATPALVPLAGPTLAHAQSGASPAAEGLAWRHGMSLFGDLKYPAWFKYFDYVEPSAPKGGAVRLGVFGTFDNLNSVVAGVKGAISAGLDLIYDTLMSPALDEVSTEYGLLAEAASYPPDFASVTYRLRPNAKWHDGMPVTPEDVIFSFEAFKANSPMLAAYYRHVVKAEKSGKRDVTFTFDAPGNRELPQIVGQIAVLPKHWWEGTDAAGNKRDIAATTLEPPLGGGAYKIEEVVPGRSIVFRRVEDYWGRNLPVNIGQNNFDTLRFEYFRDSTVALEAFKADQTDFRTESSAKNWATAYDFPAVAEKRVVKEEFPIRNMGVMQAFVLNIRREKFVDPRVRRAFNCAFDFEEMNKQIFYGQYKRIASYFEGTELASSGLPEGQELEILQTVKDKVPAKVFTVPYTNPVSGSREAVRANLLEGRRLLREAGFEVRDQRLVNAKTGEPFTVEFLASDPAFERVFLFYKPSLERLGISVSVRTVDDAQYENRLRQWDYDVITGSWGESLSPGNEQRGYWGSAAADQPGSRNLIGIKDAAIDALIERVIYATSRAELVAATRALDRVLLAHDFVVPQWTYGKQRTARWDRFGRPKTMPEYGAAAFPTIWWWDAEKALKTGGRT
ncbi:ABC transporter, periplasmic substrate-binding protein [Rhodovulum sp. PH10]|uniref:extracellular solute-binding protein n=1 Tax=Rhodovulum sp. PH10 TaxID=1187851 RepID=UPI00027C2C4B|nr:extracellular solute-binding protein [Rhodovulum sp. PH10]EJW11197.1 ABC transporter, periplasmic substrate-binding protein [Rhodovulum sp. PH10]